MKWRPKLPIESISRKNAIKLAIHHGRRAEAANAELAMAARVVRIAVQRLCEATGRTRDEIIADITEELQHDEGTNQSDAGTGNSGLSEASGEDRDAVHPGDEPAPA